MTTEQHNLWNLTRGRRLRYGGAIVAMLCANVLMFCAPLIGKYAIDVVVERDLDLGWPVLVAAARLLATDGLAPYLWVSTAAIVLLTGAGSVCLFASGRLSATASEAIARDLRERLYWRLHHLTARFYDGADTGDLVQRCSSDVETLRVFLSGDIVEIGRATLLLATVTPILFSLHASLAAASLVLLPLMVLFAYVFFTLVKGVFKVTDAAEGEMTAVLQENLTGIRVVRAFGRQDFEIGKFAGKNRTFRDHNHRLIRLMALYWAAADCLAMAQIGIVLFLGARLGLQGEVSIGTLFAFLTYLSMVMWPIRQLGRVLTDSGKAIVALGRVNEILSAEEEDLAAAGDGDSARGEIQFHDVTFGYDAGRPVVQHVSTRVGPGETLAIVGAPGAGKSTLIRLLLRLYDPQSGCIALDGRDIAGIDRKWLRNQIGVVLQDPFLYSRNVADNLRVGRPDARREHMERATSDAAIHESIAALNDGYQTLIGERGVTLSGGQRQRLALARALIKEPPILVLDDSLSAIDTGTEQQILEALRERRGRHTTVVIAHRLSSVMHADRILVLEDGRVVQSGTHAGLASEDGPYRRLWQLQSRIEL